MASTTAKNKVSSRRPDAQTHPGSLHPPFWSPYANE